MRFKKILLGISLIAISGVAIQQAALPIGNFIKQSLQLTQNTPIFTKTTGYNSNINYSLYDGNKLFIGTDNGLYVSLDAGNNFTQITSVPNTKILTICKDQNNTIWVGGYQYFGSSKDNGATFVSVPNFSFADDGFVKEIYFQSNLNVLWVAYTLDTVGQYYADTLARSDDGGKTFVNKMNYLNSQLNIGCIFSDSVNRIYVGGITYNDGEYKQWSALYVSENSGDSFNKINSLTFLGWDTTDIYQSSDGAIWVSGTYGAGSNNNYSFLFKSIDGTTFTQINSAPLTNINSVYLDKRNLIYIGTDTGLYVSTNNGTTFTQITSVPNTNKINDIHQDTNQNYWASTSAGLYGSQYGAGISYQIENNGKEVDGNYNGQPYKFINQNVIFSANDSLINKITINGKDYINTSYFTYSLTSKENSGIFNIIVYKTDGSSQNYNFYIKQNVNPSAQTFSTDTGYTLNQYTGQYAWGSKTINCLFVQGDNGSPDLKMVFNDPIYDAANSYYQKFLGFNNDGSFNLDSTKTPLGDSIVGYGNYLITITDKLGNTIQYFAQLGKTTDKQVFADSSNKNASGNALTPAGKVSPASHIAAIVGGVVGGILAIGLIIGISLNRYHHFNDKKKIKEIMSKG